MVNNTNIIPPTTIKADKFTAFYNKNKKKFPKYKRINANNALVKKIVAEIWKVTKESLAESAGGVVLDRLGYLAHWMRPEKRLATSYIEKETQHYNFFSDNYFYYTELFTDVFKNNALIGWHLDRLTSRYVKQDRYKKLRTGFKYKLYWSVLKQMYTRKHI